MLSGIAAQFTSTNGPRTRAPQSWMTRARRPFPVPGLAEEQHGRDVRAPGPVERREMAHLRAERLDRGRGADDPFGGVDHEAAIGAAGHGHKWPAGQPWPDAGRRQPRK
jgi:hypothetical protein